LSDELLVWINEPEGVRPVRPAIGLAIVKKVLWLHGWRMESWVRASERAEGSDGVNIFQFRMKVYEP